MPFTQDPQVLIWLKLVDFTKTPVFPPSANGVCPTNLASIPKEQCWWTCQKCEAPDDITSCPTTGTWGLTYDGKCYIFISVTKSYLSFLCSPGGGGVFIWITEGSSKRAQKRRLFLDCGLRPQKTKIYFRPAVRREGLNWASFSLLSCFFPPLGGSSQHSRHLRSRASSQSSRYIGSCFPSFII